MNYVIKNLILFFFFVLIHSYLQAQTDTLVQVDTVYLPADTIKKVHTVIVYEEEEQSNKVKRKNVIYSVGPTVGINVNKMNSYIGGAQFTVINNNYLASISANYNSKFTYSQGYIKHFTNYNNYIDTVETLVDEYIQIIGDDTTHIPVYTYSYIPKTDTIKTDTNYTAKNSYSSLAFPITIGYCKKKSKYMYGISAGTQLRFLIPNQNNRFVLYDSLFVPEKPYVRKMNVDAIIQGIARQKISKKIWITESCNVFFPLLNDYSDNKTKIFKVQTSILLGVNYTF